MKNIFVFFVCCLAITLVYSDSDEVRRNEELIKECEKEMIGDGQDPPELGCVYECMHKKAGYLNDDGTLKINNNVPEGFISQIILQSVQIVYQHCVQLANGDSCKVSLCLENTRKH